MIRVLHLIGSSLGGAELQLRTLLRTAASRPAATVQHEVLLLRDGPLAADFADLVPTIDLGKRHHVDPGFVHRLATTLGQRRPDVLHSWGPTPNVWGPAIARLVRRRCAVVVAEVGLDEWKGPLLQTVDRVAYRCADVVVGCAQAVTDRAVARGAARDRTATVYLGVDAGPRPDRAGVESGMVLMLARMDHRKGHLDLLRAWADVLSRHRSARLVLAGPAQSPDELALRDRVATTIADDPALTGSVTLLDRVEARAYLDRAELLVVASTSEGLPNVVLEAMAAAVPVVATDVGGIGELVEDGRTGWLVRAGRSDLLATALVTALEDPDAAADCGWAGRQQVEQLTVERSLQAWERIYADAVERRASR